MTPGTNIPSANMHKRGIHFVESIAGLGSNPKGPEMDLDEMDPQTDSNIRFRAVIRGWSNNSTKVQILTQIAEQKHKY